MDIAVEHCRVGGVQHRDVLRRSGRVVEDMEEVEVAVDRHLDDRCGLWCKPGGAAVVTVVCGRVLRFIKGNSAHRHAGVTVSSGEVKAHKPLHEAPTFAGRRAKRVTAAAWPSIDEARSAFCADT
ncbi:MAG: hypothetical protein SGJ11_09130 [Phycisphaerae bacterium]|nr:hypothetical protein [Phycisphaerae bacterium]